MEKIKLVVYNEHSLGYILPNEPNTLKILGQSVIKGAGCFLGWYEKIIHSTDTVRLANESDFHFFRVSFNGYKNNPQEYEFQQ